MIEKEKDKRAKPVQFIEKDREKRKTGDFEPPIDIEEVSYDIENEDPDKKITAGDK